MINVVFALKLLNESFFAMDLKGAQAFHVLFSFNV